VVALALVGALAGLAARAADPPAAAIAATADRCLAAADEAALLACRTTQHAAATRALGQAVDKLQQRLRDDAPEQLKLFNAAQQAWQHYRQAECRFRHRESAGGAAYPASLLACATDLSAQRLQALQTAINRP
jgi:uncharacterized protein YecT (DUF1311 family)